MKGNRGQKAMPCRHPQGPRVSMPVTPGDTALLRLNFWLHQMPEGHRGMWTMVNSEKNKFFKKRDRETSSFP